MSAPLLPKHGGYRKLRSFQAAQLIYDATVVFCDLHIPKTSRTHDQMVQAARSGVQNIAEGSVASGVSKKDREQAHQRRPGEPGGAGSRLRRLPEAAWVAAVGENEPEQARKLPKFGPGSKPVPSLQTKCRSARPKLQPTPCSASSTRPATSSVASSPALSATSSKRVASPRISTARAPARGAACRTSRTRSTSPPLADEI